MTPVPANMVATCLSSNCLPTEECGSPHSEHNQKFSDEAVQEGSPIDDIAVKTKNVVYSGITLAKPPNSEIARV